MDANESHFVVCHNGVFTLPEAIYKSLASMVTNGFVYLRQDEDGLTISSTKLNGGHRRVLNTHYRAPAFRGSTRLAIVDLREAIRVMPIT
jgi:hypothetical protein